MSRYAKFAVVLDSGLVWVLNVNVANCPDASRGYVLNAAVVCFGSRVRVLQTVGPQQRPSTFSLHEVAEQVKQPAIY